MNESDVQRVLSAWFRDRGYVVDENVKRAGGNRIDIAAKSETEEWLVEVKGDYEASTAQYAVNFDTGMGQLLKSISRLDSDTKYAIALPISRTEDRVRLSYRLILPKYRRSLVFEALNIHLLLVRDDESVETVVPNKVRGYLSSIDPQVRKY